MTLLWHLALQDRRSPRNNPGVGMQCHHLRLECDAFHHLHHKHGLQKRRAANNRFTHPTDQRTTTIKNQIRSRSHLIHVQQRQTIPGRYGGQNLLTINHPLDGIRRGRKVQQDPRLTMVKRQGLCDRISGIVIVRILGPEVFANRQNHALTSDFDG